MASLTATVIWNHRIWGLKETWRSLDQSPSSAREKTDTEMLSERHPQRPRVLASPSLNLHLDQKTRSTPGSKIPLLSFRKQQFSNFLVLGSLYALKLLRVPKTFCWDELYLSTYTWRIEYTWKIEEIKTETF